MRPKDSCFDGKTYDNYDHITKILQSFPWRPHVIALRASIDLKKLHMEELLFTLKVHEIELNKDEGQRKALKAQKDSKGSSSKTFKAEESCEKSSKEEGFHEDEIFFILRKIDSISDPGELHAYNLEIDKTFHRLIRSHRSSEMANNSHSVFASDFGVPKFDIGNSDFDPSVLNFDSDVYVSQFSVGNMVDNTKTLKELATLDVVLVSEDPYKNLKEFHVVYSIMKPHGIHEDYIKMKTFSFFLDEVAKD
ncbi:hypothetical protein CR513_53459, partial [Mucuna pruriens]